MPIPISTSIQAPAEYISLADASWEMRCRSGDLSAGSATLDLSSTAVPKLWTQRQEPFRRFFWRHQSERQIGFIQRSLDARMLWHRSIMIVIIKTTFLLSQHNIAAGVDTWTGETFCSSQWIGNSQNSMFLPHVFTLPDDASPVTSCFLTNHDAEYPSAS